MTPFQMDSKSLRAAAVKLILEQGSVRAETDHGDTFYAG
jgi:hypothetical protein